MEGLAPVLPVASARASVEWYAKLGFEVESEHSFGSGSPLYVRLRRGPAQLHLSEHRLDGGPVTHVYLYVEDIDSVIPAGAVAEDCPWGVREARLTDPDGNEVRVGSRSGRRHRGGSYDGPPARQDAITAPAGRLAFPPARRRPGAGRGRE